MKILFVTKQDYHGVPNGGSAGSKRNFQLLSELADVDLYHIKTRKNLFAYLSLIFMYFPGITLQHIFCHISRCIFIWGHSKEYKKKV